MKLRWKKNKREAGLRSIVASPRGSIYHDGKMKYASVDALGGGWLGAVIGWYWVSGWDSGVPHKNTYNSPCATEEEARDQAASFVRQHMPQICHKTKKKAGS